MLHPMQRFSHVPFVQHPMQHFPHGPFVPFVQSAAHNSPFFLNYGMGPSSTLNVHGAPSGTKSFLVYFAPEEEATYLWRAKNLGMASQQCLELTQEIVQGVNSHIACKKNRNAQRFIRAETTTEEQRQDISRAAASGSAAAVAAAEAAVAVPP